jgi:myo-inositol-1(or 4)-monophosphatase
MSPRELSASDLQNILQFTTRLAREAGDLMLEGSKEIQSAGSFVEEKLNAVDLVTKWDVAVEELVKNRIKEKYPTFKL